MLQVSPFRRRHRSGVQGIRSIAEPLDRAARGVRAVLRRVLAVTTQLEPVPTELLDLVEQLSSACTLLAADLAAERPLDDAVDALDAVARRSATVPRSSLSGDASSPRSSPRWSTCTRSPASTSTSRWPGCHPRRCPHPTTHHPTDHRPSLPRAGFAAIPMPS